MDKNLAVAIIDLNKFSKEEWKEFWGKYLYIAKIKEESYQKVTDAVDKIQEEELFTPESEGE